MKLLLPKNLSWTLQSPSPTTPANQTAASRSWLRQDTPAPRVWSAPSSPTPGGEERKERSEHANTSNPSQIFLPFPQFLSAFLAAFKDERTNGGPSLCGGRRRRQRRLDRKWCNKHVKSLTACLFAVCLEWRQIRAVNMDEKHLLLKITFLINN